MPQFEYQRGSVSVDDDTVFINGSSTTAIKLWYNERKSTMGFVIVSFIILMFMGIYQLGYYTRAIIVGGLFAVVYLLMLHFLRDFGILSGTESTIATKSIKEVRYRDIKNISGSKMTIIYTKGTDTDEEVKRREFWPTIPLFGKKDRLGPAIEAFEAAGVKTTAEAD